MRAAGAHEERAEAEGDESEGGGFGDTGGVDEGAEAIEFPDSCAWERSSAIGEGGLPAAGLDGGAERDGEAVCAEGIGAGAAIEELDVGGTVPIGELEAVERSVDGVVRGYTHLETGEGHEGGVPFDDGVGIRGAVEDDESGGIFSRTGASGIGSTGEGGAEGVLDVATDGG